MFLHVGETVNMNWCLAVTLGKWYSIGASAVHKPCAHTVGWCSPAQQARTKRERLIVLVWGLLGRALEAVQDKSSHDLIMRPKHTSGVAHTSLWCSLYCTFMLTFHCIFLANGPIIHFLHRPNTGIQMLMRWREPLQIKKGRSSTNSLGSGMKPFSVETLLRPHASGEQVCTLLRKASGVYVMSLSNISCFYGEQMRCQ